MWENKLDIGGKVELILKVDRKGRILIPAEIRERLGLKDLVKVKVADTYLVIEPLRNPLNKIYELVVDKNGDIEKDIKLYRELIEKTLERLIKDAIRNRYDTSTD